MARARSILKRVKAVRSTRTITKTMEMIATSRFKRAHNRVVAARPYTDRMSAVVADLVEALRGKDIAHPLLAADDKVKRQALLVLTGNRGLCGAYNANVLRTAVARYEELRAAGSEVLLYVVGKRGHHALKFRGYRIEETYTSFDYQPQFQAVGELADMMMAQFEDRKIASLDVAYTQFISAGRQTPGVTRVLPLEVAPATAKTAPAVRPTYEFVPSTAEVLSALLPAAVRLKLYQCFLDAAVSEQIARMTSMRAATDNADEVIHDLTVRYNRLRQSQITTELAEIMGGRAGLEEG
ncbi:MAG: ATP synthase F1 subunit gamma [Phycisphaerae bacterium]